MQLEVPDGEDSVQSKARRFYGVGTPAVEHGHRFTELEHTSTDDRPRTPRALASGRQQAHQPEDENILIPPLRVVEDEPGTDTEAYMAKNIATDMESGTASEKNDVRKVKTEEHIPQHKAEGSAKDSLHATQVAKHTKENKACDVSQDTGPDDSPEQTSQGEENQTWGRYIYEHFVKPVQNQARFQYEHDGRVIDNLEKKYSRLKQRSGEQERVISMLQEHSSQLEEKYNNAQALLLEECAHATELKSDIARLSNAIRESTRDDRYFNTKFTEIFLSVESWVLRYFMESPCSHSLPEKLKGELIVLCGEQLETFLSEDTLHTIEAVAIFLIQHQIFETRISGIVENFFPVIEGHFSSCSMDEVNAWRMNTIRMIMTDKEFPARFEKRVCEVTDLIGSLLVPLAPDTSNPKIAPARMRRLKAIVEQAARLALECSQEPSTFTFHTYSPGFKCQPTCMTDADRTVDDEHLGADGACVKFTVAPAVMRAAKCVSDEPILITKARVVRLVVRPLEAENTCVELGDVIPTTGTEFDLAFGSGSS